MKYLIILLLGLAIGFGGGIWYGVNHPAQAQHWTTEGQRKSLEAQIAIAKSSRDGLDHIIASDKAKNVTPNPETLKLRDDQDKRVKDLEEQLKKMPGE